MNEQKLFDEAIKQIQQQFGTGSVIKLNNDGANVEVIPSGSIQLDRALGIGGYPKGKIIEIFGNESSGKSTLALQAVASCQKMNGKCAYIDAEHSLDAKYCEANGIDLSKLLLAQPDSGEQAFSLMEALVKTEMIDLIIVDSVAALVPQAEIDGEISDQTIGLHARLMSKGLRLLENLMAKYNTTIIFINQIREKVGVMFGSNETTTGGRALRFYSSVRIELKRAELIKNGTECIGIRSCAKIVKNKLAAPLYKAYIEIYFNSGIDHTMEIIDFALETGVIQKRGAWYFFNDQKIGQGREATKQFLLQNIDLFDEIKQASLNFKEKDKESVEDKKQTEKK